MNPVNTHLKDLRHVERSEKLVKGCGPPKLTQYSFSKQVVTQFLKLETLLDDNVGKDFELEVERGGLTVNVTLKVNLN